MHSLLLAIVLRSVPGGDFQLSSVCVRVEYDTRRPRLINIRVNHVFAKMHNTEMLWDVKVCNLLCDNCLILYQGFWQVSELILLMLQPKDKKILRPSINQFLMNYF